MLCCLAMLGSRCFLTDFLTHSKSYVHLLFFLHPQTELSHNLERLTGWEAVMRIRCSKGLKISSFHGHFFIRSTDLLALPTIDPDKCFAVQISHEEAIVTGSVAYIQVSFEVSE